MILHPTEIQSAFTAPVIPVILKQGEKAKDVVILLANTPLGMIHLPIIKATTVHIPVILGAILLGPGAGAILGAYNALIVSVFRHKNYIEL